MGDILYEFKNFGKPQLHIKRRIDRIETQELHMSFIGGHRAWLSIETGNYINLFCDDEDGNTMEIVLPVSVEELKKALEKIPER